MKFAIKIMKALSAVLNIGLFGLVVYFMLKSQQDTDGIYSFLLNISLLLFVAAVLVSALVFISYDSRTDAKQLNKSEKKIEPAIFSQPAGDFSDIKRSIIDLGEDINHILTNNAHFLSNKIEEISKNIGKGTDLSGQNALLKDISDRIEMIAQRQDALNKNFNTVLKQLTSTTAKKNNTYIKAPEEIKYPESALKMKQTPTIAAKSANISANMPSAEEKRSFIKTPEPKINDEETNDSMSKEEAEKQLKKIFNDDLAAQLADLDILKENNNTNPVSLDYQDIDLDEYLNSKEK